jgi:hypothetical protein
MTIVAAVALLFLTAAVVLLFAMMGELASRIPETDDGTGQVTPLAEYRRGASSENWPAGLADLANRHRAALLVLSPICTTCNKVAAELSGYRADERTVPLGLIVSCGTRAAGEEFVGRYSLGDVPHLIDEGGSWVTGDFGVNMSPSALVFEEGVLIEAYTFGKVEALLERIVLVSEGTK